MIGTLGGAAAALTAGSRAFAQAVQGQASPPTTISNPPRDFGPGAPPTTYFSDPDILVADPAFNALFVGAQGAGPS